jgi:hypothetical protein
MRYNDSGTQFTLREKLIYLQHELGRGITTVWNLDAAVIVMGSKYALSESDHEVKFLAALTNEVILNTAFGVRVGVGGLINDVATKSATETAMPEEAQANKNRIQRILMTTDAMSLVGLPTPPSNIPVAAAEVCVHGG